MDRRLADGTWHATVVLVASAFCLIGVAAAGLAASLALAFALLAVGVALRLFTPEFRDSPVDEYDWLGVVPVLWIAPLVAGVVLLPFLDATAGEVQALGGVLGLLGMVNYFLRPVYHLLHGLVARVANA